MAPSYVSRLKVRQAVLRGFPATNTTELQDDTDFFGFGLDSIHLTFIAEGVRQLGIAWADNGTIYKNPTIDTLTARLRRGPGDEPLDPTVATMFRLMDTYSNFATREPNDTACMEHLEKVENGTAEAYPDGHHVLVTGATGSLGSHIVAQLVADETVTKVYCLVRHSNRFATPLARVINSLKSRKLLHSAAGDKPNAAEELKLAKIVAFNSDLARDNLGLSGGDYDELRALLTEVFHCAWTVNYNMQLTSFEHLIRGSSNLMSLCIKSTHLIPASFHFTSSISAAPGDPVAESLLTTPNTLIGASGYAQSKYVVEHLCDLAVTGCNFFVARVHRLGYLVGDRTNGLWSKSEEHPLVARSLSKIKSLPSRPRERLSWLPVDDAATACIEVMFSTDGELDEQIVFNIAHPRLISWDEIFLAGIEAADLDFDTCSSSEWVKALTAADPRYPLLEFLASAYAVDDDKSDPITTVVAERCSPHLKDCPAITVPLVKLFVQGWAIVPA